MELGFLASRIQSVLLVDTSHDIGNALESRGFRADASIVVLLACVVGLQGATANRYASQVAFLVSCAVVGIVVARFDKTLSQSHASYTYVGQYLIAVVAIVSVLKSLPPWLHNTTIVARAQFSFVYGTSTRLAELFSQSPSTLVGATVVAGVLYAQKPYWFPEDVDTHATVEAVYAIVSHLSILLGVKLVIQDDASADALQDIVYCLGLVALISFFTVIEANAGWKDYALWKIGDFIIADVNRAHALSFTTLAFLMVAVGILVSAHTFQSGRKPGTFVQLTQVLASTTVCRALLDMTQALPLCDRVTLRFLFVVTLV